jgi:hypothetical protein
VERREAVLAIVAAVHAPEDEELLESLAMGTIDIFALTTGAASTGHR